MNLILNHEGFETYLVERSSLYDGIQYMFRFENNYGASVVKHFGSYGHEDDLWELAVIKFDAETGEWNLTYGTEITDDVLGCQTDEEIRDLLKRIKEL